MSPSFDARVSPASRAASVSRIPVCPRPTLGPLSGEGIGRHPRTGAPDFAADGLDSLSLSRTLG